MVLMKRKAIIVTTIFLLSLFMFQMSSMMIMTSVAQNDRTVEIEIITQPSSLTEQPFVDSIRTFVLHFDKKAMFNNFVDSYNPVEELTFSNLKMVALEDYLSKKDEYRKIDGVDAVLDITDSKFYFYDQPELTEYIMLDDSGVKKTIQTRDLLNIDALWSLGYTGSNTVVYDIDSGIFEDHVDFEDRILNTSQSFLLTIYGAPLNDYSINDLNSHGTHTAGIAAGAGIANGDYIGMAPDADILVAKIGGAGPTVYALAGIAAMDYGLTIGVDVVNLSWGGGDSEGMDLTEIAVEEMIAQGVVVAAAAGNAGDSGFYSLDSPGSAPNALSVAGTTVTGGRYAVSSNGPTAEGYIKPDIAAPGMDIMSCGIANPFDYVLKSGTSMATPHIAGGVAVLIEALKDQGIQYDAGLIKAALMGSADLGTNSYLSNGAGLANFGTAYADIQAAPTNGSGFPVILYAHPYFPIIDYQIIPQGFHAELFVQSVSSTPWEDLVPVLSGNITTILDLNTTSVTGPWTKNFYLAINVPDDAALGLYTGVITYETATGVTANTPIEITVTEGKGKILYARLFTDYGIDNLLGQYYYAIDDLLSKGIAVNEYRLFNITGEENVITEDLLNQYDAIWLPDPFELRLDETYAISDYTEITDSEITAIQNYVNGGGGLFVDFLGLSSQETPSGDRNLGTNITRLNELISIYGIEASSALFDFGAPVKVPVTKTHAVTEGVDYIDHYGTTLTVTGNAIALAKYNNKPTVALWENLAGGRVLITSTNFHIDTQGYRDLYNAGTQNQIFAINLFNWLTAREKITADYTEDETGVDFDIYSLDPLANIDASVRLVDPTGSTFYYVSLTDVGGGLYSYRLDYTEEGIYTFILESADDKWIGEFLYDSSPPVITSGTWANYTVPESARLDFKIQDTTTDIVSTTVELNGGSISISGTGKVRTFVVLVSALIEGDNTLYIYARDAAGNVVEATYTIPTKKPKGSPVNTFYVILGLLSIAALVTFLRKRKN